MSEKKHLFFDLDRTLWDFEENSKIALKKMFQEFELNQKELTFSKFHKTYQSINRNLWKQYGAGHISKDFLRTERFQQTADALKLMEVSVNDLAEFYVTHSPQQTNLLPGAHETLSYLKNEGYILHIITNGFREVQEIKLNNCQLTDYFEVIVCSEDVGKNKPHPEIFAHALKNAGAKANHSCMIGDDYEVDYLGALRSGMHALYFNHQGKNRYRKGDILVRELSEIPGILPWIFRPQ